MDPIETTAAAFGLACVLLTIPRSIWCWPTGLVRSCWTTGGGCGCQMSWRDNVLLGVAKRTSLPEGVPAPIRPPRLVNVTIRVDDLSLNYARGRAVVEGTPISAMVNRLLDTRP